MVVMVVLIMVSVLVLTVVMRMAVVVTVVMVCIADTRSPTLNSTDVYTIVPVKKFPFADSRKRNSVSSRLQTDYSAYIVALPCAIFMAIIQRALVREL